MTSRWLTICTLLQVLVAGSAASGEPVAPAPVNRPQAATTKDAASGRSAPSTSVPTPTQNVRMVIATFLESQKRFRRHDDDGAPKLAKAGIAGPAEFKAMFSSKPPITIYCVQVDLNMTNRNLWATHDYLEAFVTFPPGENGQQRIEGEVRSIGHLKPVSDQCSGAPFTPFPELEQIRAKRRQALGKADS
jgi:hypothetical protein